MKQGKTVGISFFEMNLTLSVVLFVVIPLAGGIGTRRAGIKHKGEAYFARDSSRSSTTSPSLVSC
jgi:ACR3 family arsenite efflux pump ArsB